MFLGQSLGSKITGIFKKKDKDGTSSSSDSDSDKETKKAKKKLAGMNIDSHR